MKNNAKVIKTDGNQYEILPANGKVFKLAELQKIVGGYIEILFLDNNMCMVLNEEGKLNNLPFNQTASSIAKDNGICDYIVGDVLMCQSKMIN